MKMKQQRPERHTVPGVALFIVSIVVIHQKESIKVESCAIGCFLSENHLCPKILKGVSSTISRHISDASVKALCLGVCPVKVWIIEVGKYLLLPVIDHAYKLIERRYLQTLTFVTPFTEKLHRFFS